MSTTLAGLSDAELLEHCQGALSPKFDYPCYCFADESGVWQLKTHWMKTPMWAGHWADRTPIRGYDERDPTTECTSYYDTAAEVIRVLIEGGEGPAVDPALFLPWSIR
jgi:hypothetical protein